MSVVDVVSWIFLVLGSVFVVIGGLGLLRREGGTPVVDEDVTTRLS